MTTEWKKSAGNYGKCKNITYQLSNNGKNPSGVGDYTAKVGWYKKNNSTVNWYKETRMDNYEGVCGYVQDPAIGDWENGIATGTAFADLPQEWVCTRYGVGNINLNNYINHLYGGGNYLCLLQGSSIFSP